MDPSPEDCSPSVRCFLSRSRQKSANRTRGPGLSCRARSNSVPPRCGFAM